MKLFTILGQALWSICVGVAGALFSMWSIGMYFYQTSGGVETNGGEDFAAGVAMLLGGSYAFLVAVALAIVFLARKPFRKIAGERPAPVIV